MLGDVLVAVGVKLRSVLGLVVLVVRLFVIIRIAIVSEWIRWFINGVPAYSNTRNCECDPRERAMARITDKHEA